MSTPHPPEYVLGLIREFCKLPREIEWVEFKENNADPTEVGEYISALSNAAALAGKASGYLLWGVRDSDHVVVGTHFDPSTAKKGNEELENWLLKLLTPKLDFHFYSVDDAGKRVVVLQIERAHRQPTRFESEEFIRVGSYKKKLKDVPEKERALWRLFDQTSFEERIAREHASAEQVVALLDCQAYFDLMQRPSPAVREKLLGDLAADGLICPDGAGSWNITNLGAVLFAKRLSDFGSLGRKAVRVIVYDGRGRLKTVKEQLASKGYACGFEELLSFVNGLIPAREVLTQGPRKTERMFPPLALRELVANALIHQDFFATGTGPMVELFSDRVEITNPGRPLVSTDRLVDAPPRSRNEALASLMRRMGICEERGSGVDKVVRETELALLPAPAFENPDDSTRATLFAARQLTTMPPADRVRACYLHACLRRVERDYLTNTSLRERFGLKGSSISQVSRFIREAVEAKQIVAVDANAAKKMMKYVPWWDAPTPRVAVTP